MAFEKEGGPGRVGPVLGRSLLFYLGAVRLFESPPQDWRLPNLLRRGLLIYQRSAFLNRVRHGMVGLIYPKIASSVSGTQVGRKLADAELVVLIQMVSNPDKSVDL